MTQRDLRPLAQAYLNSISNLEQRQQAICDATRTGAEAKAAVGRNILIGGDLTQPNDTAGRA